MSDYDAMDRARRSVSGRMPRTSITKAEMRKLDALRLADGLPAIFTDREKGLMKYTYRVVVAREGNPGFCGASGVYSTLAEAQHQLGEIARTWIGLAEPEWHGTRAFTVRPSDPDLSEQTYSILIERTI